MTCLDENEIVQYLGQPSVSLRDRVDRHVDLCPSCRRLLSEAARTSLGCQVTLPLATTHEHEAPVPAAPQGQETWQVGRFQALRALGMGGCGVVLLAYDPQLDRRVAIKLLRSASSPSAPHGQSGLLREARAMARITHPNVVAVYEVGAEGERVFVAMEYVEGTTLRAWLARPRSTAEILRAFDQAAEGLSAAHGAGLIHRDFKPENVLVRVDGRISVTDFGLASVRSQACQGESTAEALSSVTRETSLTQSGLVVGTPRYMAPEQYRSRAVDARADQFAFCVALFEALYGEHPFPFKRLDDLVRAVEQGAVKLPARAQAPREVPPFVQRALLRGLSPRPEARFPNMSELRAALHSGEPSPRPRRRLSLAASAAVVTFMFAFVTLSHGEDQRPKDRPDEHRVAQESRVGPAQQHAATAIPPGVETTATGERMPAVDAVKPSRTSSTEVVPGARIARSKRKAAPAKHVTLPSEPESAPVPALSPTEPPPAPQGSAPPRRGPSMRFDDFR